MTALIVEADGGSRGNPGPAGYGAVVRDPSSGVALAERAMAIGRATNNVAEYRGLIAGLEAATELGGTSIEARLDSKLVVEQMSGRWRVKHADLKPLALRAAALVRGFKSVRFTWVPRAENSHADRLANEAMDAATRGEAWEASTSTAEVDAAQPTLAAEPQLPEPQGDPTTMLLVRHGECDYIHETRFVGAMDRPMNAVGERQAHAIAGRLAKVHVDAIVASPLARAQFTAQAIAEHVGVEVATDDGFAERGLGEWEGMERADVPRKWPDLYASWVTSPDVASPGGESLVDLARRVRRARDRVLSSYPGKTVVVASHFGVIRALVEMGLGMRPGASRSRISIDLMSLSIIDWHADGSARVRLVNDTCHLS